MKIDGVTLGFGVTEGGNDYGLMAYYDNDQFNEATSEFKEIASKLPKENNLVENLSRVLSRRGKVNRAGRTESRRRSRLWGSEVER